MQVTTLSNGIKVASVDTGASVSRVSISSNVGSRHESVSNLGIAHLMKNASFMVCKEFWSFQSLDKWPVFNYETNRKPVFQYWSDCSLNHVNNYSS